MSGVAIIRALAVAYAPLTTFVPAVRIIAGQVKQGAAMPSIGISEIYTSEIRNTARNLPTKTSRARIQLTVLTKDPNGYTQMKDILKAAGLGPGVHTGQVGAYKVLAVEPMGTNPEIPPDDDGIYEQSRDFMVTFTEPN